MPVPPSGGVAGTWPRIGHRTRSAISSTDRRSPAARSRASARPTADSVALPRRVARARPAHPRLEDAADAVARRGAGRGRRRDPRAGGSGSPRRSADPTAGSARRARPAAGPGRDRRRSAAGRRASPRRGSRRPGRRRGSRSARSRRAGRRRRRRRRDRDDERRATTAAGAPRRGSSSALPRRVASGVASLAARGRASRLTAPTGAEVATSEPRAVRRRPACHHEIATSPATAAAADDVERWPERDARERQAAAVSTTAIQDPQDDPARRREDGSDHRRRPGDDRGAAGQGDHAGRHRRGDERDDQRG